ncbi:MarC family protein [Methyloterricola oryzae]|uniref:MarC family protein n=1 Tax=Methyloterricola oryzae TaxID=1495050 RepID=UPI001F32765B|nr:MarC family protein [Methyloterricola oryzae]
MSIVDPVGAIPVFLYLTVSRSPEVRRRIAFNCASAVSLVLLGALLAGEHVLCLFSISVPAFQIAGGVLIMTMGTSMLHASPDRSRHTPQERLLSYDKASIAVVPLGILLLGGPGAMSAIIVYAHEKCSCWQHYLLVSLAIGTVAVAVLAALWMAPMIASKLGKTGVNVITRVMGLITFSIAVECIAKGLTELFPALGKPA